MISRMGRDVYMDPGTSMQMNMTTMHVAILSEVCVMRRRTLVRHEHNMGMTDDAMRRGRYEDARTVEVREICCM